jgi:hypothetical protein
MENNFMNELFKYTNTADSKKTKNEDAEKSEDIDELIKSMENDYGLINIIKSYQDYENDHEKEKSNEEEEIGNSVLFSNYFIKSSFSKMNTLKKLLARKENILLIHYLDKWKRKANKKKNYDFDNLTSNDNYDYLSKNRKIIEAYCEITDTSDYNSNYLNPDSNYQYDLPLQSPLKNTKYEKTEEDKENLNTDDNKLYDSNNIEINSKLVFANFIKMTLNEKLKNIFNNTIHRLENYNNSRKIKNSSLSLLYLFTQLTISQNKNKNSYHIPGNNYSNNEELKQKLIEYEKKISKYESCLNEKADIIASRNDRIEQQIETIELLTEEINRLNTKIEKLEKKGKNLNIIQGNLN